MRVLTVMAALCAVCGTAAADVVVTVDAVETYVNVREEPASASAVVGHGMIV